MPLIPADWQLAKISCVGLALLPECSDRKPTPGPIPWAFALGWLPLICQLPLICEPFLHRRKKTFLRLLLLPWQGTIRLLCEWETLSPGILGVWDYQEAFPKGLASSTWGFTPTEHSHLLPWRFTLLAATARLAVRFYTISWQVHLYYLEVWKLKVSF